MEVILAKSAGFCFGVEKAVDQVYEQIKRRAADDSRIYTYGPIIHNEEVVKDLSRKGVAVIADEAQLAQIKDGVVVIRSHGVAKDIHNRLKAQGLTCVDATCPFVKRIHKIAEEESVSGHPLIIIGNAGHPEVEGIIGWAGNQAFVIESPEEALNFDISGKQHSTLVSQTTFNYNKFQDIVEILKKKGYNGNVVNTICNATKERQTEAGRIAAQADAMIVIGDKHSSNSRKLYEICKKECARTYFIQTLNDLHLDLPKTAKLVGITAGASTPNNIIEEVQNYVRINF